MHTLRVCYELAQEHPEHLERGVSTDDDISHAINAQNNNQTAVEEAREQARKITDGLDTFMLKPEGMKGEALFHHMIQFRKRNNGTKASMYFAIDVNETQESILNPTMTDMARGAIIACVGGVGARLKLAQRKLDNLGYINSHCGIQNDEKRMGHLKLQLELTSSIAEVKRDDIQNEEEAAKKARNDLQTKAPTAAKKYMDKKYVTKKDLCAILFAAFGVHVKELNHKKAELNNMVKENVEKNSDMAIINLIVDTNSNAVTSNESGHVETNNNAMKVRMLCQAQMTCQR